MSETYGNTGMQNDDTTRKLGAVEVPSTTSDFPGDGLETGTSGTPSSPVVNDGGTGASPPAGTSQSSDTKATAKDEARATGDQAKEGARHVAEVGKDEVKNVVQESSQQAKELWHQTRDQLLDQSAQQQTRVASGLRSLSQELSSMANGSEQQGVATDLAQQASTRMGDVAGWLDQRDPGSLVAEVKQFARQRPGAFLATAAAIGLVGGRLSRGLVADSHDQPDTASPSQATSTSPDLVTGSRSAYDSPTGAGEFPR